jgi:hypothetical protein
MTTLLPERATPAKRTPGSYYTPRVLLGRRGVLAIAAALIAAGCARISPRAPEPTPVASPDLDTWNRELRGMLADALESLRTFDAFQAFRVGAAPESGVRLASELAWDPPTTSAWDSATHVARGLSGRAAQLFAAATTVQIDPSLWREQRAMAAAAHAAMDLGNALAAYRDRVDRLPVGDGAGALPLLDAAWTHFDALADAWSAGRGEVLNPSS